MMISFEVTGNACLGEWPMIAIYVNDRHLGEYKIVGTSLIDVVVPQHALTGRNYLQIKYINKTQQHTAVKDGVIVEDQSIELHRCWVDDILCEPWFLTEGHWYPRYFPGFLESFPDVDIKIKSQLIWHFPGDYEIFFPENFWHWYCFERRKYAPKANTDKDTERWENYSGNFERHRDVINEIRKLLDG